MTLGDLYSGSLSISLDIARNTILDTLQERGKGNNYIQLQNDLNKYFYGQNRQNSINEVDKLINQKMEEHAVDILNSLELGEISNVRKFKKDSQEMQSMRTSTLKNKIADLKIKVKQLEAGLNLKDPLQVDVISAQAKLNALKSTILEAIRALHAAGAYLSKKGPGHLISGDPLTNVTRLYNELNAYDKALESFSSISQATGEVLEVGLNKFANGLKKWQKSIGDNIIEESFSEKTGQRVRSRGGALIELVEMNIEGFSEKESYDLTERIQSGNVSMTTTYDTGSARQIKMDVSFYFSGGAYGTGSDFRISAKNWARTGSYGSLGSTNLLSALSRSSNKHAEFSLGMLSNYQDYAAFELGRLSIMADIAAGLSQQSGYANTLVVNTGTAIKVIDIGKVIKEAMIQPLNYSKGMNIKGYSFAPLKQTALNTFINGLSNVDSPGRTKLFLNLYYGYLKNVKVSMSINANTLAVK